MEKESEFQRDSESLGGMPERDRDRDGERDGEIEREGEGERGDVCAAGTRYACVHHESSHGSMSCAGGSVT